MSSGPDSSALKPLDYHVSVVDYLRRHEPEVWKWAGERCTHSEQIESLRTALLKDTYRIDGEAHSDINRALSLAMERLGIQVPATLYQSPGEMNAALIYVPGEVHIILQGSLLDRLVGDELLAVFGHELSHYLLWSRDEASFLIADRVLNDALAASEHASHRETYRRYVLHTELFADRGSAIAAGGVAPAVSALVKLSTGMGTVDPASYLRQAAEIDSRETSNSEALSHPETFIRARALALWWDNVPDLPDWIASRLLGRPSLERLDLLGQLRMQQDTRGFLAHFLAGTGLASDAVLAQVRMMFPDWHDNEPTLGVDHFGPQYVDDSVRAYLNALMMDLALADPDQREVALLHVGKIAQALGSFESLQQNLRRDAGFGKREMDKYKRQLAKEAQA